MQHECTGDQAGRDGAFDPSLQRMVCTRRIGGRLWRYGWQGMTSTCTNYGVRMRWPCAAQSSGARSTRHGRHRRKDTPHSRRYASLCTACRDAAVTICSPVATVKSSRVVSQVHGKPQHAIGIHNCNSRAPTTSCFTIVLLVDDAHPCHHRDACSLQADSSVTLRALKVRKQNEWLGDDV